MLLLEKVIFTVSSFLEDTVVEAPPDDLKKSQSYYPSNENLCIRWIMRTHQTRQVSSRIISSKIVARLLLWCVTVLWIGPSCQITKQEQL